MGQLARLADQLVDGGHVISILEVWSAWGWRPAMNPRDFRGYPIQRLARKDPPPKSAGTDIPKNLGVYPEENPLVNIDPAPRH
jgi:hypothetical protein